jgi:hypothetical protein
MVKLGQIVLFNFPQTDLIIGRKRPALVLKLLPNNYQDWLVCMISSKTGQEIPNLDEVISPNDADFQETVLKSETPSISVVLYKPLIPLSKVSSSIICLFKLNSYIFLEIA